MVRSYRAERDRRIGSLCDLLSAAYKNKKKQLRRRNIQHENQRHEYLEELPVFRAEKSHTKKHATEFSGFDIEISYVNSQEDVMKVQEQILAYALKAVSDKLGAKVKVFRKTS